MRRPRLENTRPFPTEDIPAPADAAETAAFIASAVAGLAKMAGAAGLSTLNCLLNMARIEAEDHLAELNPPS